MSELTGNVILLTGASAGIGLAAAQLLADKNHTLILTARRHSLDELRQKISGPGIHHRVLDLNDENSCRELMDSVLSEFGKIDVLINNAGVSYRSVVEHLQREDELIQMNTNFFGPLYLIRRCLPKMREMHRGKIINVSSVGGMMAMPTMGIYSASKFALEGLSESLWYEMKPWNIHVTLVQPGFVKSDSYQRVLLSELAKKAVEEKSTYYNYYIHMTRFVESFMNKAMATPEGIAKLIEKIILQRNPPLRMPVGIDAHFFAWLRRWMPRSMYHAFLYKMLPGIERWGTGKRD